MGVRKFELPVAVTLRLQSRSGRVDVIAEPRDDVLAEGDDIQAQSDDGGATLRIRNGRGSKPFEVRCPVGTDVMIGTQSGNVRMTGEFGTVSVTTASGSIRYHLRRIASHGVVTASAITESNSRQIPGGSGSGTGQRPRAGTRT